MQKRSFLVVALAFAIVVASYVAIVDGRAIGASMAPFATTFCASSSPCIVGSNSSTGIAVEGGSANGRGVYGVTKHNSTSASTASYGVEGQDASTSGAYDSGIYGLSILGTGVSGSSTSGTGVSATSTNGYGVSATSTNGVAMVASSAQNYGLYVTSGSYGVVGLGGTGVAGIYGDAGSYGTYGIGGGAGAFGYSSSGRGVLGESSTSSAVYGTSDSGFGLEGHSGGSQAGAYITNANGTGADITGTYIGVVARAPGSGGFPILATDAQAHDLFYVDGMGNVFYHGSLSTFVARGGVTSRVYSTRSTAPALEETGTAHLTRGRAIVYLSRAFSGEIDSRRGYTVFLTPDGDTRGLYVAGKYAAGFVVREIQGGRGTFDFDYHVLATTSDSNEPNSGMQPEPNAPIIRTARVAPQLLPSPRKPKP